MKTFGNIFRLRPPFVESGPDGLALISDESDPRYSALVTTFMYCASLEQDQEPFLQEQLVQFLRGSIQRIKLDFDVDVLVSNSITLDSFRLANMPQYRETNVSSCLPAV